MSNKRIRAFFCGARAAVVVGALCHVFTAAPGTAAEVSELEQLRRELAEARKYMEALEKRVRAQETKMIAKEKEPALEAGYDGGFYIRSKDKPFSLNINGFAQFTYSLSRPEGGDVNHTFDVSLARLALSGIVFDPKLSYFMQIQGSTLGNSNTLTMLDWWMKYSFMQELGLQAGRFVLPYSRQFFTHPGNLLFADLSETDYAFNLPRSIGAHLSGKLGRLSYHGAVLNGIRALDAAGQQNFGDEMGFLGRLEFDVLDAYGYYETSPKPPSRPQLSVGLAAAFNPIESASSFQNLMPGDRTANVTLDLGFRYQSLSFQAAGYYRHNDMAFGITNADDWGYYSQLGYYLVPERLEIAGRISGVKFDKLNVAGVFRDTTVYTAGLNYYLYGHNLKMQMDYSFLDQKPFEGSKRGNHRARLQAQFLF